MNTINAQTHGPYNVQGNRVLASSGKCLCSIPARLNDADEWEHLSPENAANARLIPAACGLLDKAGRALNVDAAILAEGLDLVELIRFVGEVSTYPSFLGEKAKALLAISLPTRP